MSKVDMAIDMPISDVVNATGEKIMTIVAVAIQDALIHGESVVRVKIRDSRLLFAVEHVEK